MTQVAVDFRSVPIDQRAVPRDPTGPIYLPHLRPAPEALVFRGPARGFERMAVPGVELEPGDLLVQIELATVCGSDRHTASGKREEDLPLVLGHEQVGRIVAVGPGVPPRSVDDRELSVGDRVVWGVAISCMKCSRCLRGLSNKCLLLRKYGHARITRGWELNGGFASHVHVLAGSDIVIAPEHLPAEVLAPATCATATVVAAFDALTQPSLEDEIVVVSGCGMLGLTAVSMASSLGAVVVGIDPDPRRRDEAAAFGAAITCPPGAEALLEALAKVAAPTDDGSLGFSVAFEISGSNQAVETLLSVAGVGASIVLVGHVFPSPPLQLDAEQVVRRLVTVTGVHNYRAEHLLRAVEFLETADHAAFAALVGETVTLDNAAAAIEVPPSRGSRIGIRP